MDIQDIQDSREWIEDIYTWMTDDTVDRAIEQVSKNLGQGNQGNRSLTGRCARLQDQLICSRGINEKLKKTTPKVIGAVSLGCSSLLYSAYGISLSTYLAPLIPLGVGVGVVWCAHSRFIKEEARIDNAVDNLAENSPEYSSRRRNKTGEYFCGAE